MITETILKYILPDNDIIFTKDKSLLTFKYSKSNFDEKGYPKGIIISYDQIIQLVRYNDDEPIKFAISSKEFVYQLRLYISSNYLNKGKDYINSTYVSNGYQFCERTFTLGKYFEPMGTYKELFSSDELILLRSHIQSDKINIKMVAYQLNYY